MNARVLMAAACVALSACTTPYVPPVVVKDSAQFKGLVDLLSPEQPLDVLLVHGMCTHDAGWAKEAMRRLATIVDSNVALQTREEVALMAAADGTPAIQLVVSEAVIAGSKLRMTGVVWSPLTTQLKQQLLYDNTGEPTDCATDAICKPKRAKLNGGLKDSLLNDCLADALAYQGASRLVIRKAMIDAFTKALDGTPVDARVVLISDSLGSKISFDALSEMLQAGAASRAQAAAARMGSIYMNANQLPILGLADQTIPTPGPPGTLGLTADAKSGLAPGADSLQSFVAARARVQETLKTKAPNLTLVAFTDPNDLLSYRLLPSRYKSAQVDVADVLVSNQTTYLGLFERPDTAHTSYMENPAVATAIACGIPKSTRCR